LLKRHRNTLDISVLLLLEAETSLKEHDPFVLLGKHSHQALHEVLAQSVLQPESSDTRDQTYPDFLPVVIFHLQGTQAMLQRNDQAMARDKLLCLGTAQIGSFTECDNGSLRRPVVLVAKLTRVERFLGLCVICMASGSSQLLKAADTMDQHKAANIPLTANALLSASVFCLFLASLSALSSM
jgi:hypothetical protein